MSYNYKKNNTITVFAGGMLVGMIVFLMIYGIDVVKFTNDSYIINGYLEKDIAQHYTGWMLYRNSPWQFPLGVGQNIAYPYGSAVSFTDSIPLFAIIFKAFSGLLPATFQYFGLFVMLCFMLQGGFGALLSNLFNKSLFIDILASCVFVFTPVMIERAFRHCSLTAHFFILACLYYYFRNKGRTDFKAVLPFFIINAAALTVHPYFMPFTFGIMFAFCVEMFFIQKKYISSVLYIIGSLAVTALTGYTIGAFSISGSLSSLGYGYFNMNLNALYNPVSKGFDNWSAILEIKPNISGQIEGFNYLGLGILLFIPVSLILYTVNYKKDIIKTAFAFVKNYFGILFSTAVLLIFAVGDWLVFGGLKIFRMPIPESITNGIFGIFRANGRFGWLLVYMIILFVIHTVTTCKKDKLVPVLLIVMLAIQISDMRYVLQSKYNYFHNKDGDMQGQVVQPILTNSFWDDAAEKYDVAHMVYNPVANSCIEIAEKFGMAGKAANTAFEAKIDSAAFSSRNAEIKAMINSGTLDENTIVFIDYIENDIINGVYEYGYNVFWVEGIYTICNSKFTDNEIQQYISDGRFVTLEYPYSYSES